MPEDISSPPYPGEGTTTAGLHRMLVELAVWVRGDRAAVNAAVGRTVVPDLPPGVTLVQLQNQPVFQLFRIVSSLRRLRERWDVLVRTHEDGWDSEPCLRSRALHMAFAVELLAGCGKSFERREAEAQRRDEREAFARTMERLTDTLFSAWEPEDEQASADAGP